MIVYLVLFHSCIFGKETQGASKITLAQIEAFNCASDHTYNATNSNFDHDHMHIVTEYLVDFELNN